MRMNNVEGIGYKFHIGDVVLYCDKEFTIKERDLYEKRYGITNKELNGGRYFVREETLKLVNKNKRGTNPRDEMGRFTSVQRETERDICAMEADIHWLQTQIKSLEKRIEALERKQNNINNC